MERDGAAGGAQRAELGRTRDANVGDVERVVSLAAGAGLAVYGLTRRGWLGTGLALASVELLRRGATGRCHLYQVLRINRADTHPGRAAVVKHREGVRIERAVTVNRPPAELYRLWRDFTRLPRFTEWLATVQVQDDRRSHWVARGPAGRTVAWEAEIITERENELLGWRTLPGSDIAHAGSVHFTPAPGGRGTEVRVVLEYHPPAGYVGSTIAALFGAEPGMQLREDLRHFKQIIEAGETPVASQTAARPQGAAGRSGPWAGEPMRSS